MATPIDVVVFKCRQNLSDGKSCVIYPNKKTIKFRLLSLLRGSRPKKSASARHGRRNVSKSGTARVEKRAQQARESRRQRRLGVEVWGGVSPSQPTRGSGERRELP